MNAPEDGRQNGPEDRASLQNVPGPDHPDHDPAKGRFVMLQMMRFGGVLMVIGALLILSGKVPGPPALGYGLLVFGAFEFFFMPMMLAKRWKTPDQ